MKRNIRVFVRLTQEEKDAILKRAQEHAYTMSSFIREGAVLGKVQPVLSINLQQWARLAGLMANVNQLTRHCNAGHIPADVVPVLEDVRKQVNAIREDLATKREQPHN
jgi:hypothetical protein